MNTTQDSDPWYLSDPTVFVSRPLRSYLFDNFYFFIFNSYHYRLFPKFYFFKNKYYIEGAIDFAGYTLKIQLNKIEKIQKS